MDVNNNCCPRCGKPLARVANGGRIGFCSVHKWQPLVADAVQEANDQAHLECPLCYAKIEEFACDRRIGFCAEHKWQPMYPDAGELARKQNEADEIARRKKILREKKEKQRRAIMKAFLIILLLLALAAGLVYWFIVLPKLNYTQAQALLSSGDYAGAKAMFTELGEYESAPAQVVLCDAMLDLERNDISGAMAKLDSLTGEENAAFAAALRDSLLPIVENWQAHGITPDGLLTLLEKRASFDPDGKLDANALFVEAHVAMASEETMLSWYVADVNGDAEDDLVVLRPGLDVVVYKMTADGNAKVTADKSLSAQCLVNFGDTYGESDAAMAHSCYEQAYALHQDTATREKLGTSYQRRATASETAEDYASALADAQLALDVLNTAEAFGFLADMQLRSCFAMDNLSDGVVAWETFVGAQGAAIDRFGKADTIRETTGMLHLEYAKELASWRDPACPQELEAAQALGMDVSETLAACIELYDVGKTRAQLRLMSMDLCADAPEKMAAEKALLEEEVAKALGGWKELNIGVQDVFALLLIAEEQSMALDSVDAQQVYRDAALAATASEQWKRTDFVQWDGEAHEELLGLNAEGELVYCALDDAKTLQPAARWATGLTAPTAEILDDAAHTVLVLAQDGTAFALCRVNDHAIETAFSVSGVEHYARENLAITYDVLLEGSIARYAQFSVDAAAEQIGARRVGVDWQQDAYPMPKTAYDAVIRFFEANAYAITEEAALLFAQGDGELFTTTAFDALGEPDAPLAATVTLYNEDDVQALYEVVYQSGGEDVRVYVHVDLAENKVTGMSTHFTGEDNAAAKVDTSYAILPLNEQVDAELASRTEMQAYRVMLPQDARIQLNWQAGAKQGSREAFVVNLYRASNTTTPYMTYSLMLSALKQASNPLYLPAGVYYVTVEGKDSQNLAYSIELRAQANAFIEREDNSTLIDANEIAVNQTYSASLQAKDDVDVYAFTLDEAGAVNVQIESDKGEQKNTRYALALADGASYVLLEQAAMPANVQKAAMSAIYLDAGRYFLQIEKGQTWSAGEYSIYVGFEPMTGVETELNNTAATADVLELTNGRGSVKGSFGVSGDVDTYSFQLVQDSVVQPSLGFSPLETNSKTYVLSILRGENELLKANIGGKEATKVITPLALPAGSYTIKLENPNFINQGYTLGLVALGVDQAEREVNNELSMATLIAFDTPVTGVIVTEEDVDLYRIVLDQETIATLRFTFDPMTGSDNVFSLRLEQNGKSAWSTNVKANAGKYETKMQIPAGEYYLRVKAGTAWSTAVYTMELDTQE